MASAFADVAFSVILPTYNRGQVIDGAIRSVLAQTHCSFELIIVDDGSTDGTEYDLREAYATEIAQRRIVLLRFSRNLGMCAARNAGLLMASNSWIAYVDSDNLIAPHFLESFARAIVEHDEAMTFYSRFFHEGLGFSLGEAFDWPKIRRGNYIDLGVFVHNIQCFHALEGFDIRLRRLVDWDLILRYTKTYLPVFLDDVLLTYRDSNAYERITTREPLTPAMAAILRKQGELATVSTVIPTYNQQDYIAQAIDSALAQEGDFYQDIVVADDGSSDDTPHIVADYCKRYPHQVRSIGDGINRGISGNFRRCFEAAAGAYVAVLEGDDFWTDTGKLAKQIGFLEANPDCSMVFSKILIHDLRSGTQSTLERQDGIAKDRLSGTDFLADPSLNLIANFSSCLFRTDLMQHLPRALFRHRFSEIALAFHLDRHGLLGFLDEVMSVYRQHERGVWSGASPQMQLIGGRQTREIAKAVARDVYKAPIQAIIDTRYALVAEDG